MTRMQLLPVSDDQLKRLDALIERLMELGDLLDGDPDLEPEPDEDADEGSYIWVTTQSGRVRMA